MNFFELLDGLLTELDIPFYEGQPEFERSAPEAFISYDVYEVPNLYGDGAEKTTTYHVTINVFASGADRAETVRNLCTALTILLTENKFIRRGGSYTLSDDFPRYYRKIIEFNYDYDNEEGEN